MRLPNLLLFLLALCTACTREGVQLFADNDWQSDFIRKYGIRGIPRFILLDDRGKIVTAEAERPSDPRLTERLNALEL